MRRIAYITESECASYLKSHAGACTAALGYAERLVELEPENARWLDQLATASFAVGKPTALVRAVYEQSYGWSPPTQVPIQRARDRARLALLTGDFDEAEKQLDDWEHVLAGNNEEKAHADLFHVRALFQREVGEEVASLAQAHAFLASRAAWSPSAEGDSSIDAEIALYRGSALSRPAFAISRSEWLERERTQPSAPGRLGMTPGRWWIAAYADSVVTPQDAQDALATLRDYQPLPPDRLRITSDDEAIGRTYLLAGRTEEALPFLRRAANSCKAATYPVEHSWANLELGFALESSDVPGACASYKVVIERWGASPRSHSAYRARARWQALGCR